MTAPTMSVARQFAVNVVAQGLARLLSIGANIVLLVVVARAMGTAAFGQFSYVLAFSTIAVGLADLGTTAVLARGLGQHEEQRAAFLGNFLLMRIGLALVVMAGALAVLVALPGAPSAALLVMIAGLPFLATRFFEPIYQVYGKPWLSPVSNGAFGAAQLLLALVVWMRPGFSIAQVSAGIVLTNALYAAVACWLMLSVVRPVLRPHRELLRDILLLAGPLGVASIFTTIIVRADVMILAHLRGDVEAGLYGAAYRVLDLAVFLAVTVVTPLIPILTRQIALDRQAALEQCRLAYRLAALATLPAVIVTPAIAPGVLRTVLGPDFEASAAPLNILVVNFALIVFSLLSSSINVSNGVVSHAYWNAPAACALNLSLNFLLIPSIGMVGAAWATVGSQLFMLVVTHYFLVTRLGSPFEWDPWLRIFAACVLLWTCLQVTAHLGPVLSASVSLALYVAVVCASGLVPRGIVNAVLIDRAKRRLGPST